MTTFVTIFLAVVLGFLAGVITVMTYVIHRASRLAKEQQICEQEMTDMLEKVLKDITEEPKETKVRKISVKDRVETPSES